MSARLGAAAGARGPAALGLPLCALLLAATAASAAEPTPSPAPSGRLAGHYSLGPASLVDPPPGAPPQQVLRLALSGPAARDLYQAMRGTPRRDACFDDGTRSKSAGQVLCARHPDGRHACWIGVDLLQGRLAAGLVC